MTRPEGDPKNLGSLSGKRHRTDPAIPQQTEPYSHSMLAGGLVEMS